jgi:hypothetical protein
MIKFFRKIRQRLLSENKFSKYLIYAIGEILLVVVGILIALWINNANQNYKNEQLARTFLSDFKRDLEADIQTLDEKILKNLKQIQNIDSIRSYTQGQVQFIPIKKNHFNSWVNSLTTESYYVPEKTTIRQFESSNSSNLIRSKVLKDKLFSYYNANDLNENNMERSVQLYQHNYLSKDLMNLYKTNYINADKSMRLLNNLRSDFDFIMAVNFKRAITNNQKNKYLEMKAMAKEIIEIINSELE